MEGFEEPLKSEAFKTILAKLMDSEEAKKEEVTEKDNHAPNIPKFSTNRLDEKGTGKICSSINRTEFPAIYKLKTALGRALFVLNITRNKYGIEGLLPSEISKILKISFRLKDTAASIQVSLANATEYVDRKPIKVQGGQSYKYYIMHKGEEYLDTILKERENGTSKGLS